MISKKIKSFIKLQIQAGMASPAPPVGPALGQQGVNIVNFCKLFNEKTKDTEKGLLVPVIVTVYSDKTFTFIIKSSPASILLKKAANIELGSSKPGKIISGKIKYKQIIEIAKIKLDDMTSYNLTSASKSIKGTAHSMGLEIIEEYDD